MQTTAANPATHTSHTPGPWIWDDNRLRPEQPDPARSEVHSILDAEGGFGFVGSDWRQTLAEIDADRRLIAASPDLLEAVKRLLNWDRQINGLRAEDVAFAAAAIAKATGQQGSPA